MTLYDIIFYLFALVTISSAYLVVTVRNIVYSAFSLLFTLFGIAGLYALLGADFVAIVQLIVYVGGILILMIFGVMLTNKITNVQIKTGVFQILPATIGVGIFGGFLLAVLLNTNWLNLNVKDSPATTFQLGQLLMNEWVLPFELLGIVLLIALLGAASIARK
ncbi:MAG: NADH-quinone oxidoreductase subunit J [Ignavibacteria bacterium RIFOXYB2_FULL_35_12]|nr:MAG: NADH-quinone oxidoreductase subunit J [Ignavibacteria bacterium GWA2_36_19]OGU55754.1 MAG: NADH-quinone oxidoreductase subunit J [Ignavibacteria bacterium GWC2_35_8]OGU57074.1 MAG: NADH-quinone oxidoreductase subunit J [Ignavibacteria bacterium GWF2_35_20]OGU82714.1 MAG: NADH-quinone oxidoreductase subunit J [Ignavibacteria bacterium RIFOXYA2_FULL_35_9]OGU84739.1 MAG: NADH-quinone oxidoreductase subunit J [Ignavibacteria bacterium RIFOXYA12_FULL_35_25]OGU90669.1 MAG: NADH-quinone oxido